MMVSCGSRFYTNRGSFRATAIKSPSESSLRFRAASRWSDHFLGHEHQQAPVARANSLEKPAEIVQDAGILAGAAPRGITFLLQREIRQLGRFLAIIEKLVQRNFQRARHLFQGFDGRNSMAILDAGNVATQQSGAFLDISLR